ncbi:MAG: SpoIIE family protein phosphatase [Saprospiraceae bacterium]|nr:SpoIIE family protein phosphatase [Saprospiraceae bacterium]MCB0684671.1 SpoIIE family protein phosphatase [Saprospiraceae bacterium]
MSTTSIIKTLSNSTLFKGFAPEEVWQILASGSVKQLKPGETLIAPGTSNDTLYLLIDGGLEVILEKDGVEVSLPIPPGECLGEMSLVGGNPTSARAVAHKLSRVLLIPEETFWNQLALTRTGAQNLLGMMARRLQRNNEALIERVEKQLKYQLMEKELETAGKIQSGIVPDGRHLFPKRPEVDAFALINQAREVGGDFFDAMALDSERIYFAIGDVSGKGMPAALFMMRILTSMRLFLSNSPGFEEVLPAVNNWLARDNDDLMFVSVFAGVLNVRTGLLQYVNAGHPPPFASIGGGAFDLMELPKGLLLGIVPQTPFPLTEVQLKPGDALVLYTDGITEARGSRQAMFDFQRTKKALNRRKQSDAQSLVQALETAVEEFVGQAPQMDDYTIFALRYLG